MSLLGLLIAYERRLTCRRICNPKDAALDSHWTMSDSWPHRWSSCSVIPSHSAYSSIRSKITRPGTISEELCVEGIAEWLEYKLISNKPRHISFLGVNIYTQYVMKGLLQEVRTFLIKAVALLPGRQSYAT